MKREKGLNTRRRAVPGCPYCGSEIAVRRGFRKNLSGKKQLFLCRACGRKFTPDDGFLRMRFPAGTIREVVSLYRKGFSSSEVQRRMERRGTKVSRWTIICWAKRFGV